MRRKMDRITFTIVIFILMFLLILYRLVDLQVIQGQTYRDTALHNRLREIVIESQRGNIYDRNMSILATSTYGESVAVFPAEIKASKYEPQQMAENLADILSMSEEEVFNKLTMDSSFVWLKRKIPFEAGPLIASLDYPGIELFEESQRYYPKGRLASQTIGFAGLDNQGLSGLEVTYDEILRGTAGKIVIEMDSKNREIPETVHSYQVPEPGADLVLTLDANLQYRVEKKAADLLLSSEAERVIVLVMDIKTGEILAMTGMPDFEPARYGEYLAESWLNPAIQEVYEPGSTFKIVSAAAMLDGDVVNPDDDFHCNGFAHAGGLTIRCWRASNPHGDETFLEAFGNSCNPVFVETALKSKEIDENLLYSYYEALGFGKKTTMQFAAQANGIMPESNRDIYLATSAIGQGIAVTPVQLASAIATIVGDGSKINPVLVKSIQNQTGDFLSSTTGRTEQQIIDPQTVMMMRDMMEQAVLQGTASMGSIEGYRIGGKTGTAQKPNEMGGYHKDKFITSFVSVGPMEDPAVLSLVIVDSPLDPDASGGRTAGPTSASILREALEFMGIEPDYLEISENLSALNQEDNQNENENALKIVVPDLIGKNLDEALIMLEQVGLEGNFETNGYVVTQQSPIKGSKVEPGSVVVLTVSSLSEVHNQVVVPDLIGLRVPQALIRLAEIGLRLSVSGDGYIYEQTPMAGILLPKDTIVSVVCRKEIP